DARSLFALDATGEQAQGRPPTQHCLELRPRRLEQATQRGEVLLGENLGRRHQRALVAVCQCVDQTNRRDGGLAGADFALQQPSWENASVAARGRSAPGRADSAQLRAARRRRLWRSASAPSGCARAARARSGQRSTGEQARGGGYGWAADRRVRTTDLPGPI